MQGSQSAARPFARPHDAPALIADVPRIIDLYGYLRVGSGARLRSGGEGAYCYYGPSTLSPIAGTELEGWVDELYGRIDRELPQDVEDFRFSHGGVHFRGCRETNEYGQHVSLRMLPNDVPRLSDLNFVTPAARTLLSGAWLHEGLIVFCGLTGQGKTTLAGATSRTRLETYGGRMAGVEDVLEMPLEGVWGPGSCRQLQVNYADPNPQRRGFTGAVRRAYRVLPATRPAYLYLGEVRDGETAEEAIKAGSNGMLVITTIHAGDPISAMTRLITLGKERLGEAAYDAVAQSVRLIVHSRLDLSPTTTGWKRGRFATDILASHDHTSPVANVIRSGKINMLGQPLDYQRRHLEASRLHPKPESELLRLLFNKD